MPPLVKKSARRDEPEHVQKLVKQARIVASSRECTHCSKKFEFTVIGIETGTSEYFPHHRRAVACGLIRLKALKKPHSPVVNIWDSFGGAPVEVR